MASTTMVFGATGGFGLYRTTVGKKAVMAVTGFILFVYVFAHLIGNLQIYLGREQINHYAEFLHSKPLLLWIARLVLFSAVALHITAAFQLWLLKRKARPVGYIKENNPPAGYASRTMIWSGPFIAAFVIFHILHLTTGSLGLPYRELDVYDNLVNGFRLLPVSIFYTIAMALLCLHLYHGLWSMFQSLGVNHPRYTPWLKRLSAALAIFIAAGNISIPIAVLGGWIGS